MNKVFTLVENNNNNVIIKVNAENNLVIAQHPYIDSSYDYITVTKGGNHILTIIYKNGSTYSFHWGISGYTLISDILEVLKKNVIHFIEQECHIPLELTSNIKSAKIYYNSNFKMWQLTLNGAANIWSQTATSLEEMKEWVKDYVKVIKWVHRIAPTGIDVWDAVL